MFKGWVDSCFELEINCVYEIVIDGVDEMCVWNVMWCVLYVVVWFGVVVVGVGNYGGELGCF